MRTVAGDLISGCPATVSAEALELFGWYTTFKATGSLPYAGGYMDQPAIWVDVITHVTSEVNRFEAELLRDRARRANDGNHQQGH